MFTGARTCRAYRPERLLRPVEGMGEELRGEAGKHRTGHVVSVSQFHTCGQGWSIFLTMTRAEDRDVQDRHDLRRRRAYGRPRAGTVGLHRPLGLEQPGFRSHVPDLDALEYSESCRLGNFCQHKA